MTGYTKVGGVWRTITAVYYKVGGVWRVVSNAYTKVGGVWRVWHSPATGGSTAMSWDDLFSLSVGSTANVTLTMRRDGDVSITSTNSAAPGGNDWIQPRSATVGDAWHCRLVRVSGNNPNGSGTLSAGTWYQISANRTWIWTQSPFGTTSGTYRMELSNNGGSSVQRSHTFDATAQSTNVPGGGG